MTGVIFDIQRFAVHDGPGIRTTVFLKGCSARCAWCHNPESIHPTPQLRYDPGRCVLCGRCVEVCPRGAHTIRGIHHTLDRTRCIQCGRCAEECYTDALMMSGREETLGEVLGQVLEDRVYYAQSGGGVTLSGGEPVLQGDFAEALLRALREEGIHTCLQTAGYYPYGMLERLLPYLDLVMYDIKGCSPAIYSDYIHVRREVVFDNLKRLGESGVPLIVRTPCIRPVNDTPEEIGAIARMLAGIGNLRHYMLLPYHDLGKIKYDTLGVTFVPFETPPPEYLAMLERIAARYVPVFNLNKGLITPSGEDYT